MSVRVIGPNFINVLHASQGTQRCWQICTCRCIHSQSCPWYPIASSYGFTYAYVGPNLWTKHRRKGSSAAAGELFKNRAWSTWAGGYFRGRFWICKFALRSGSPAEAAEERETPHCRWQTTKARAESSSGTTRAGRKKAHHSQSGVSR